MRLAISVLIIACLSATAVKAQSIADLARRERARRAAETSRGRVYTGVERDVTSRISVPVGVDSGAGAEAPLIPSVPVSDEASADAEPLSPETGRTTESVEAASAADPIQELRDQITEQMDMINELEARRVSGVLEVNRLRGVFQAPTTSQSAQRGLQIEIDAAQDLLGQIENALVEGEQTLAELLAELDRVSVAAP